MPWPGATGKGLCRNTRRCPPLQPHPGSGCSKIATPSRSERRERRPALDGRLAYGAFLTHQLKCKRVHRGYGSYDDKPNDIADLATNSEIGPTLDPAVNGSN